MFPTHETVTAWTFTHNRIGSASRVNPLKFDATGRPTLTAETQPNA